MSYADTFPTGAMVFIPGQLPLIVGRYLDHLPGVELVQDGRHVMTVNPKHLVSMAVGVDRRLDAAFDLGYTNSCSTVCIASGPCLVRNPFNETFDTTS